MVCALSTGSSSKVKAGTSSPPFLESSVSCRTLPPPLLDPPQDPSVPARARPSGIALSFPLAASPSGLTRRLRGHTCRPPLPLRSLLLGPSPCRHRAPPHSAGSHWPLGPLTAHPLPLPLSPLHPRPAARRVPVLRRLGQERQDLLTPSPLSPVCLSRTPRTAWKNQADPRPRKAGTRSGPGGRPHACDAQQEPDFHLADASPSPESSSGQGTGSPSNARPTGPGLGLGWVWVSVHTRGPLN